ncbi:MAG: hypothetical protein QOC92_955 [Acidimicrobiaceae bacterium]
MSDPALLLVDEPSAGLAPTVIADDVDDLDQDRVAELLGVGRLLSARMSATVKGRRDG